MRRLTHYVILTLMVVPSVAVAQVVTGERPQTIMEAGVSHGFFAGADVLVTELAGEAAMGLRFEGAWIGAHRLVAGLAVSALIPPSRRTNDVEIESLGYVGAFLGYRIGAMRPVHGTAGILIGAGGLEVTGVDGDDSDWDEAVFLAEPSVGVEMNVARFARLGLGVGYRYVGGVGLDKLGDRDLSGFAGNVGVRLGRF